MTLLDAIEQIAEQAEDSALSENYFRQVRKLRTIGLKDKKSPKH